MKVSIITPSYNQGKFLGRTIDSIWGQTGDFDLEHILVDGGSSDNSLDIIKYYDQLISSGEFIPKCKNLTFKWIYEKDSGQSDAINIGFALSSGEILGWINSDDIFLSKNSLSVINSSFLKSDADIVVGNSRHIDEHDNELSIPLLINRLDNDSFQERIGSLYKYNFILQPSCLFKRSVWEKSKLDINYHFVMDWVFLLKAYSDGCRFYKIDYFIAANRVHESAKTVAGGMEKYSEGMRIFKKYNTWCLNRCYYYIYLLLMRTDSDTFLSRPKQLLAEKAKKIRQLLINKLRIY